MLADEYYDVMELLRGLKETDFRKIVYLLFAKYISDGQVQVRHGPGEHGVDMVATISEKIDPLRKGQALLIQLKHGDISYPEWEKEVSCQLHAALRTRLYPFSMNQDYSVRLLLITNGEIKPEAFDGIKEWNKYERIPIEPYDISTLPGFFFDLNLYREEIEELIDYGIEGTIFGQKT